MEEAKESSLEWADDDATAPALTDIRAGRLTDATEGGGGGGIRGHFMRRAR